MASSTMALTPARAEARGRVAEPEPAPATGAAPEVEVEEGRTFYIVTTVLGVTMFVLAVLAVAEAVMVFVTMNQR
ncbi:MAG: hypothetical protein HY719_05145 [Planctomycetes bacterium]|nr:hypothetical protein [Planctomycetota bacterium]